MSNKEIIIKNMGKSKIIVTCLFNNTIQLIQ